MRRRHAHLMLKKSLFMLGEIGEIVQELLIHVKNITPVILPRTVRPIVVD